MLDSLERTLPFSNFVNSELQYNWNRASGSSNGGVILPRPCPPALQASSVGVAPASAQFFGSERPAMIMISSGVKRKSQAWWNGERGVVVDVAESEKKRTIQRRRL